MEPRKATRTEFLPVQANPEEVGTTAAGLLLFEEGRGRLDSGCAWGAPTDEVED